ncbi:hypothetical protein QZH41_012470 [Actinostola sp. cb2023]|nr:hypothetical protein QZH41_012470 [Actinostola sp. cb2023]
MVDVVESQQHLAHPAPSFSPCTERNVEDFLNGSTKHKMLAIVFEEPYSYVGKELILDMMRFPQIDVRRSTDRKSPLLHKYNIARIRFPVLIALEQGAKPTELSRMKRTHADFKNTLHDIGYQRQFEEQPFPRLDAVEKAIEHFENLHNEHMNKHKHTTGTGSEVYMLDMVSGLSHMIWNEVPNHSEIKSKAFSALRNFVGLVADCFPGKGSLRKFFRKLYIRLSARVLSQRITRDSFLDMAKNINKVPVRPGAIHFSFLTKKRHWHACQGSEVHFRGYPCSLWTLFHTLTVNCAAKRKLLEEPDDGLRTLTLIRDYVKHFFGCTKCVEHFTAMSAKIHKEVTTHDDAILWLWEGHNKANKRLHGDPSEDPAHPKIQFPPEDTCKDCQEKDGKWKRDVVLQFLKNHYGVDNIRIKPPANLPAELEDVDQVRRAHASIFATAFNLGLTRYDTSLCLVVYTAIGLAFVALYIYFIRRRRRRRPYKYHIHTP